MKRRLAAILLLGILLFTAAAGAGEEKESVYTLVAYKEDEYALYDLAGTGWLVEAPYDVSYPELIAKQANHYLTYARSFGISDVSVYLINTSRSVDFDNLQDEPKIWPLLEEYYAGCRMGSLEIHSIEEYCDWFYKTDHHWNYKGSYKAYTEIIPLVLGGDEPLMEPAETVHFPFVFNGSYNKLLGRGDSDETFSVYRFEYPEMTIQVNLKRRASYGRAKVYFSGDAAADVSIFTNHYGEFYGGDSGTVLFSTERPEKESILVISNSYSNAINMLIASHFNNTLVADLRLFDDETGVETSLEQLVKKYGITKILLLGDAGFFRW